MSRAVLVLGSSGQIGAPLCAHLRGLGHSVTEFDLTMGPEFDLRTPDNPQLRRALDAADYVFFLAFDVGGAPYLTRRATAFDFAAGNTALMSHTFEALRRWGGPFAFASSQMSLLPRTPYGALKAVGEHFTDALGGTSVRLWNVYGIERDPVRAHVITDFVRMAAEDGVIAMRTRGDERRDFMHVDDCARGLVQVMNTFEVGPAEPVCMGTGTWTSIREVAEIVADVFGVRVEAGSAEDPFAESSHLAPRMGDVPGWHPDIPLREGIRMLVDQQLPVRHPVG